MNDKLDNEMYVIENQLNGVSDPEKLKLPWIIKEEPGECWTNLNGKMITWDSSGRMLDMYGFLVDNKGNQITDADGNFIKASDQESSK